MTQSHDVPPALAATQQLLDAAFRHLAMDPERAKAAFSDALAALAGMAGDMAGLLRVRLDMCRALAAMRQCRIAEAAAYARQALAEAASLPWPCETAKPRLPFSPEQGYNVLEGTLAQLAARGCIAFATGGTLLGLVRDGRLLPFDKDLDVATPIQSFPQVCRTLLEQGWRESWIPIQALNYRCFLHEEKEITLDVFGYDFDTRLNRVVGGWWPAGLPREAGRVLHLSEFQVTRRHGTHGTYWAVQEPEGLLAELYGPGWRTPDPEFDSNLGTPALVAHNDFTHAWGYLRLVEARLHGQRRIFARLLHLLAQLDPGDPVPAACRAMLAAEAHETACRIR